MTLADRVQQAAEAYANVQAKQWPRRQQDDARKAAIAGFLTGGFTALGVLLGSAGGLSTEEMKAAFGDVADRLGFSAEKPKPATVRTGLHPDCIRWGCDGDHKYYSHDPKTGDLIPWEEA